MFPRVVMSSQIRHLPVVCCIDCDHCFIFFLLPETKQTPIEEIHLLWQKHWLWKSYCAPEDQSEKTGMKPQQLV
ncbi:hypothetical protein L1987_14176 [Smallanthus sonchifolius]|uniref:Uncharacterized protein n=2 Tax=Smallanthus sonchifolius TaxID=185202 RepID=A0ACB9J2J6_9ASTR|nr:hypothetical protein L1987_14169 [Smallanthus sonchifolius]KAI3814536.1 hypothetical protein L1987_14176 [Smallanthus sonchifolius]